MSWILAGLAAFACPVDLILLTVDEDVKIARKLLFQIQAAALLSEN